MTTSPACSAAVADAALMRALEAAQVGVFDYAVDGARLRLSPSAMRILGWPVRGDAPRWRQLHARVHAEDRQRLRAIVASLAPDGPGAFAVELRVRSGEGECVVQAHGATEFEDTGGVRRALRSRGSVIDVTDRREAERRVHDRHLDSSAPAASAEAESMRQNDLRRVLALEAGRLAAWDYDLATGRVTWDVRMTDFLGMPGDRGPSSSNGWLDLVHEEDRARVAAEFFASVAGRRSHQFEYRVRRPDGEERWFLSAGKPLCREDGSVERVVGIAQDITERKRAEDALRASEARFRAVQETSIDGFMILESLRDSSQLIVDFQWAYLNEAAQGLLGKARGPLTGRRLLDALPGARAGGLFEVCRQVAVSGAPWSGEVFYAHDGLDLHCRLVVARTGDGVAMSFADLAEQRRADQRLRASEDRLQIALEAARAGAFDWNLNTDERHWSEGMYRLLALAPATAAPSYALWCKHVHPEDLAAVERCWNAAIRSAERYAVNYRLTAADGVERWVQEHGLIAAAPAQQRRLVGAIVDITELKRAQAESALAARRKDEFLATLSHELRNPLAPIRTAAQLLASSKLAPAQLSWVQRVIQRQVGHMSSLLDDLLDVARITQGKLELKEERVDLTAIIDAAVEAARPLLDRKGHRLTLALPASPLTIWADGLRLSQMLSNLLTNAAKYTDAGGHIEVSSRIDAGTLRIAVQDDGIGLSPDAQGQIFTMFSQVDGSAGRAEGGLGIGLALVKAITELHGGAVEAFSAGTGQGSEFVIRLPLSRITAALECVSEAPAPAAPGVCRILVADDNRDAADGLALLLGLSGHEVRVAHGGSVAVLLAETFKPEVAVIDIGMPDLDGYAVARQLRRGEAGQGLCLIALTGWGQAADKERARAAGFDHHLTKPVDVETLQALVAARHSATHTAALGA